MIDINSQDKNWFVYIILSNDQRLYTGITTDLHRRWKEHTDDLKKGAKFFRGRKPKELKFVQIYANRAQASKREYQIKQLTRIKKYKLIESNENQLDSISSPIT